MPDSQAKKDVSRLLRKELPGILAWMVRGCLDWQAKGLDAPEEVTAATDTYKQDEDVLGLFIGEHCLVAKGLSVQSGELHARYKTWAEASGLGALSVTRFGKAIADRGFAKRKDGCIYYDGIGLSPIAPSGSATGSGHSGHSGQNSGFNASYTREDDSTRESVQSVQSVQKAPREVEL